VSSVTGTIQSSWVWWPWVTSHGHLILAALRQHVVLTAEAVGIGLVISLPLAVLARRLPRTEALVVGTTGALYTIPSLAAIGLLLPLTGLGYLTAEVMLVGYTLLILVRNTLIGLAAVPEEIREAARGMGFGPVRMLLRIEMPLALPAIVAGIRIATVTTIGLVTVTALIGLGGLGSLIYDGLNREFHTPLVVGSVLSVVLAVTADIALVGVQRLVTPWARAARG